MGSFGWYVEVFCGYYYNFSYRSSAPFPLTAREAIREARVLASYLRYYKGKDHPYPKIFVFAPDANSDSGQLRREYTNIDPLAERGWSGIVRTISTIEPPINVWRVASPLIANVTVGLKRLSQVERQVRGSRD